MLTNSNPQISVLAPHSFMAQSSQMPSIVSSGDASEWMNLGLVAAFHTVTVLVAQG
jgi:hypothetical protein